VYTGFRAVELDTLENLILPSSAQDATGVVRRDVLLRECYRTSKKDALGADFVYVEAATDRVHRFQLKLGMKQITEEDFRNIVNNFAPMQQIATEAYERLGLRLDQNSCTYLITTRSYKPDHAAALAGKVLLISKKILGDYCVWPEQVKDLGMPYM
jgi:hypothetical protein